MWQTLVIFEIREIWNSDWPGLIKSFVISIAGVERALSEARSKHREKVVYLEENQGSKNWKSRYRVAKKTKLYWRSQCLSWMSPLPLHCTLIRSLFQGWIWTPCIIAYDLLSSEVPWTPVSQCLGMHISYELGKAIFYLIIWILIMA